MTLVQLLAPIFVLTIAFPYTQVLPVAQNSYTQPFSYGVAILVLAAGRRPLQYLTARQWTVILSFAALGALLLLLSVGVRPQAQEIKYLLSFVTPLLLVPALARVVEHYPALVRYVLGGAIVTWGVVAFLQAVAFPGLATGLVGQWGEVAYYLERSGRGVLGFAPEPTHHAFHILLLGATLALLDRTGAWWWFVAACVADAVLLAQSASAMAVLALAGILLLGLRRPVWLLMAGAVISAAWAVLPSVLPAILGYDSRAGQLVLAFFQNPFDWIVSDFSVNSRLGGVYVVAMDILQRGLLPAGLSWNQWLVTRETALLEHRWLLGLSDVGPPSGLLAVVYQAGFLSLPILGAMLRPILRLQRKPLLYQGVLIAAPLVFLGQYYLSAPTFSLLVAAAWWRGRTEGAQVSA